MFCPQCARRAIIFNNQYRVGHSSSNELNVVNPTSLRAVFHLDDHTCQAQFVAIAQQRFRVRDKLATIEGGSIGAAQIGQVDQTIPTMNLKMKPRYAVWTSAEGGQINVGLDIAFRTPSPNAKGLDNWQDQALPPDLENNRSLFVKRSQSQVAPLRSGPFGTLHHKSLFIVARARLLSTEIFVLLHDFTLHSLLSKLASQNQFAELKYGPIMQYRGHLWHKLYTIQERAVGAVQVYHR